jgi:16S rRNA (cytosine967-C5)-methyltransferase
MRPGARVQEVIDIIDAYQPDLGPLDEFVSSYLKQRRYIGSGDRRQINADLFNVFRAFPRLKKMCEASDLALNGRNLVLMYMDKIVGEPIEDLFTGEKYQPAALSENEIQVLSKNVANAQHDFPDWLYDKLSPVFETEAHFAKLNQQATVDLCVNTHLMTREKVIEELAGKGIQAEKTPHSPFGVRLQKRVDLKQLDLIKKGIIDIQDEGAQLIGLHCDVQPGMTICDYCAGAGGKTRTLSILLKNSGMVIATDIAPERLQRLEQRLKPGPHNNIKVLTLAEVHEQAQEACDRVLLDVPCSGTGTLRRHPELKMTLTPEKIEEYVVMQRQILSDAVHLVKPNGYLIYATCSLLREENEDQAEWFLKQYPNFKQVNDFLSTSPYTHGTDGFFAAVFEKVFA